MMNRVLNTVLFVLVSSVHFLYGQTDFGARVGSALPLQPSYLSGTQTLLLQTYDRRSPLYPDYFFVKWYLPTDYSSRFIRQIYLARSLDSAGRLKDAVQLYKSLTAINALYSQPTANVWRRLGVCYQRMALYDSALTAYNIGLKLSKANNDSACLAAIHLDLASVYVDLRDSIRIYELIEDGESFAGRRKIRCWDQQVSIVEGEALLDNDKENALILFKNVISACENRCPVKLVIRAQLGYASALLLAGNLSGAEEVLRNILQISRIENDRYYEAEALLAIGRLHLLRKRYRDALLHFRQCFSISEKDMYNEITLQAYTGFIEIYSTLGDDENLERALSNYINLRRRIITGENLIRVSSRLAEFETREDADLLEDQKFLIQSQARVIEQKRLANALIGIALVLLCLIVWILRNVIKRKRSVNDSLDRLVCVTTRELEEQQLALERRTIELKIELEMVLRQLQARLSTSRGVLYLSEKTSINLKDTEEVEMKDLVAELSRQIRSIKEVLGIDEAAREAFDVTDEGIQRGN